MKKYTLFSLSIIIVLFSNAQSFDYVKAAQVYWKYRCRLVGDYVTPDSINTMGEPGFLITDATSASTLTVTDVLGHLILSKPLVTNYDVTLLPVDGLPSGVYICAVEQNGRTTMNSKIIVAHQ